MSFALAAPSVALFSAGAVALVVALASFNKTAVNGGTALSLMMCAVVIWAVASGLEAGSVGLQRKLLFTVIAYTGTVNVAPLFFVFALRYRRREWRFPWWYFACLWLVPAVTMVLAVTNGAHGLLWTGYIIDPARANTLIYQHGPWYVISVSYYAALGCAAAFFIGRAALRSQRVFVGQTGILLAGLLIPWLAAALMFMPFNPFPGLDLPPIAFAITGFLLLVGMRRFNLLDIVPVARDTLVERMTDGLVVLDHQVRVVDINPAARALLGVGPEIGTGARKLVGVVGEAIAQMSDGCDEHREILVPGSPELHLDVRSLRLRGGVSSRSGLLIVIRDITDRKRMDLEREALITELRTALSDVKTLSGLLPICSSCKKIRDDSGYWRTLERYLSEHSGAQFSHGLCDDCIRTLYPEADPKGSATSA